MANDVKPDGQQASKLADNVVSTISRGESVSPFQSEINSLSNQDRLLFVQELQQQATLKSTPNAERSLSVDASLDMKTGQIIDIDIVSTNNPLKRSGVADRQRTDLFTPAGGESIDARQKSADTRFQELDKKYDASFRGGPELSPSESADYESQAKFPNSSDEKYRELYRKHIMSKHGGPAMSSQEKSELAGAADQISKREFPNDPLCQKYDKKEWLHNVANGPKLTSEEQADFDSRIRYPNDSDAQFRALYKKETMSRFYGGPKLTAQEKASLDSKSMFPEESDKHFRELYKKERLAAANEGPKLTREEKADLESKQMFRDNANKPYQELYKKHLLSEAGGPALTSKEKIELAGAADLVSKKQFPDAGPGDDYNRSIENKRWKAIFGQGPRLTKEETLYLLEEKLKSIAGKK